MAEGEVIESPRYLHEGGRPVVQIRAFLRGDPNRPVTPELANQLIDFFKAPGPYSAFLAAARRISRPVRDSAGFRWDKSPPSRLAALKRGRFPLHLQIVELFAQHLDRLLSYLPQPHLETQRELFDVVHVVAHDPRGG